MTIKTIVLSKQVEEVLNRRVKVVEIEVDSISELYIESCDLFNCDIIDLTVDGMTDRGKYIAEITSISKCCGVEQQSKVEIIAESYQYAKVVVSQFNKVNFAGSVVTSESLILERDMNTHDSKHKLNIGANMLGVISNTPPNSRIKDIDDVKSVQVDKW